jgi:HPt (histidine-containing phosphotransfer) domain-containing protein
VALKRVAGDRELLRELVTVFLDECPRWLEELRAAVAGQDATRVQRLAHTTKGALGQLGAEVAFAVAERLERMGREARLTGAEEAHAALEKEFLRLQPVLRQFATTRS